MNGDLLNSARQAVRHWWVSLLVGILAIGLGIWCISAPWATIIALSYVFAITFLISGLSEIIFAVSNKDSISGWGWTLASGIIDILFGIIILTLPPAMLTLILAYFVGFWIMFRSIWGIGSAADLQRLNVKGWGWLMALAIIGVIISFIFILSPVFTAGFVVALVSISFVAYGIFRIYLGFKLRSFGKENDLLK